MKPAVSTSAYYWVCATLLGLVAATAVLAFVNLGPLNGPIAVVIAAIKALLIVLFFMHVRVSERLIWLAAGLGFAWLGILFVLTLSDYIARGAVHIPGK